MKTFVLALYLWAIVTFLALANAQGANVKPDELQNITNSLVQTNDLFLLYDLSAGITKKLEVGQLDLRYTKAFSTNSCPAGKYAQSINSLASLSCAASSWDGDLTFLNSHGIGGSGSPYNPAFLYLDSLTASRPLVSDANKQVVSTTYGAFTANLSVMEGDAGSGGAKGLVPAQASGDASKCLKGDGTWGACSGGASGTANFDAGSLSDPSVKFGDTTEKIGLFRSADDGMGMGYNGNSYLGLFKQGYAGVHANIFYLNMDGASAQNPFFTVNDYASTITLAGDADGDLTRGGNIRCGGRSSSFGEKCKFYAAGSSPKVTIDSTHLTTEYGIVVNGTSYNVATIQSGDSDYVSLYDSIPRRLAYFSASDAVMDGLNLYLNGKGTAAQTTHLKPGTRSDTITLEGDVDGNADHGGWVKAGGRDSSFGEKVQIGAVSTTIATFETTGVTTNSVVIQTADSEPTCDSSQRGRIWYKNGAGGVADIAEICMKDAANSYAWKTFATP